MSDIGATWQSPAGPDGSDKAGWRRRIAEDRAAVPSRLRNREANSLTTHFAHKILGDGLLLPGSTLCSYLPVGTEPGSIEIAETARAGGVRVLLPVTGEPGPLDWAEFTSAARLRPARFGLLEPDGPPLGVDAIAAARVVLVPAVAVDRRGVRLGRGAGYYDRTLGLAAPTARVIAVVRDGEIVAELPEEAHDLRVGWALTPTAGVVRLGPRTDR